MMEVRDKGAHCIQGPFNPLDAVDPLQDRLRHLVDVTIPETQQWCPEGIQQRTLYRAAAAIVPLTGGHTSSMQYVASHMRSMLAQQAL